MMCALFSITLSAQEKIPAKGFAVFSDDWQFKPYEFTRHTVGDNETVFDITEEKREDAKRLGQLNM